MLPAGYVGLFTILGERARECGYALTLHGSLKNDMDVVAIPWTDEAVAAKDLVKALHDSITFLKVDAAMDNQFYGGEGFEDCSRISGPEYKPHNRLAWNIYLGAGAKVDVSVMPRRNDPALPIFDVVQAEDEEGWVVGRLIFDSIWAQLYQSRDQVACFTLADHLRQVRCQPYRIRVNEETGNLTVVTRADIPLATFDQTNRVAADVLLRILNRLD